MRQRLIVGRAGDVVRPGSTPVLRHGVSVVRQRQVDRHVAVAVDLADVVELHRQHAAQAEVETGGVFVDERSLEIRIDRAVACRRPPSRSGWPQSARTESCRPSSNRSA